jgi:glycine/D-amino acid oxidase-like deaminating enzyme/nitrite reductase/ring-hydroxylating ferredoxin subunit
MERGSGRTLSPWMAGIETPAFPYLDRDLDVDVCVVGGGISGLSVAVALAREGKSLAVLEDGASIGSGESSRTTALLSSAVDDHYHVIERLHGADGARKTAESHRAAIDQIERNAIEESIDCQFQRVDEYLYAASGESQDVLEREYQACRRAGLDVAWADRAPFGGFDTGRSLRFPRQGQFHPVRYLVGLATAIVRRQGRIFTSTHATAIEGGKDGASARVRTGRGHTVTARHVVVATNTPVQDVLTMHTKQHPYRSYAIAARVPSSSVVPAMFVDTARPYHYARYHSFDDYDLVIAGGEDHKTGQANDAIGRYRRIADWARARFPMMGAIEYTWSGQLMEPVDAVAFIGRNPGDENVWVVTGDSGNGMTHATIAGLMLPELIAGRDHPWSHLYDPSRKSVRSAVEYVRENLNMAAQYAQWLTGGDAEVQEQIASGSGGVMRDGIKKVACYRDARGDVHRMSATCPHLGAIVTWNADEGTWDCPAHGSRFDALGHVVNGPANSNLSALPNDDDDD